MPLTQRVGLKLAMAIILAMPLGPGAARAAAEHAISVDAGELRGFVQPTTVGQMMEWALPEMNQAWAEKALDRSIESDSVLARRSSLYDAFTGTALDRSRWTPMS